MTTERLAELLKSDAPELTTEELLQGWHWCAENDLLPTKYSDPECYCGDEDFWKAWVWERSQKCEAEAT